MEKALETISDNLNNKYEELFIIPSISSHMKVVFDQAIQLDPTRKYKLALKHFSVYNSIKNITENNNTLKIAKSSENNVAFKVITIPPGSYEISDINNLIAETSGMDGDENYNIEFHPNVNLNKVKLILRNNWTVNFDCDNSVNNVLGFEKKHYLKSSMAPKRSNIENDINVINIHTDLITGGWYGKELQNIIYSMPSFSIPVGYRIIEQPIKPIYLPLNRDMIKEINVYIKDGRGRLLDFSNEEIVVQLHLKQV